MRAALRAERLKLRRSGVVWLPFFGLFVGLLQGGLFLLNPSPDAVPTWQNLTAWQNLWITFLSPLTLALLAGVTSLREAQARGGGTWWRPVSPLSLYLAEFAILAALALLTTAFVVLVSLPFGYVMQLSGTPSLARLLSLVLTLWFTSLPILALYQGLARVVGLIGSLMVSLIGAMFYVFFDVLGPEGLLWWLNPWAWPVRATLKLAGTHANGLMLEPTSPVWNLPIWPALLLAALTTPVFLLLGTRMPRERHTFSHSFFPHYRRNAVKVSVRAYRRSLLKSEWTKYRHTVLPWLTLLTPLFFALVAVGWGASSAWQLWALLALPFGAALLPSVAWLWEGDAWRALRTRRVSTARLYVAKLTMLWLHGNISALLLVFLFGWLGLAWRTIFYLLVLHASVSFLLLALHLLLTVRFGAGVSLGVGTVMTLLALILGGTDLGSAVWSVFPWLWAWSPVKLSVSITPFVVMAGALGLALTWMGSSIAKRLT